MQNPSEPKKRIVLAKDYAILNSPEMWYLRLGVYPCVETSVLIKQKPQEELNQLERMLRTGITDRHFIAKKYPDGIGDIERINPNQDPWNTELIRKYFFEGQHNEALQLRESLNEHARRLCAVYPAEVFATDYQKGELRVRYESTVKTVSTDLFLGNIELKDMVFIHHGYVIGKVPKKEL